MAKNYRLMDEILDDLRYIKQHGWSPDGTWTWDQGAWARNLDECSTWVREGVVGVRGIESLPNVCGTAMCFAGSAVFKRDYNFVWDSGYSASEYCKHIVTGERAEINDKARRLLGLTTFEADELFAGGNDLDRIEEIVHGWKVEDGLAKELCETCGQELPDDDGDDCHTELGQRFERV